MSDITIPKMFSPRFWLSFALTLAITSWIPVGTRQIGETAVRIHIYDFYRSVLADFTWRALLVVIMHLAGCFILSLTVRRGILRSLQKTKD